MVTRGAKTVVTCDDNSGGWGGEATDWFRRARRRKIDRKERTRPERDTRVYASEIKTSKLLRAPGKTILLYIRLTSWIVFDGIWAVISAQDYRHFNDGV